MVDGGRGGIGGVKIVEKIMVEMGCLGGRNKKKMVVKLVLWLLLLLEWRRRWRREGSRS